MLLADARSRIEVEKALAEGDEELASDIEGQIDVAVEEITLDFEHKIEREDSELADHIERLADAVRNESPVDLSGVTIEFLVEEISQELDAFDVQDDPCGRGMVSIMTMAHNYYVWVDPDRFMDNAEFVPMYEAASFYEKIEDAVPHYSISWSYGTGVLQAQSAWLEDYQGEPSRVCVDQYRFAEICYDIARRWVGELLRKDPDEAIDSFLKQLASFDRRIERDLREQGVPESDLIELATTWSMADGDSDRAQVVEEIRDYLNAISSEPGQTYEVIEEFTQEDIRRMGIRSGTLYENAPWLLVRLAPSMLRAEGVKMKHCVGDRSMGYIKRVSSGDIEIWSLRRASDQKPRFTLEVDGSYYDDEGTPESRGASILQLKGAANRLPGYDMRSQSGSPPKPDEIIFWARALEGLGVDPHYVDDLNLDQLERKSLSANRHVMRTIRSFDRPHMPLNG